MNHLEELIRHGQTLIQCLGTIVNLKICAYRIIQRLQTCLIPEQVGRIKHIAREIDIHTQLEQVSRHTQCASPAHTKLARLCKLAWNVRCQL